MAAEFSQDTLDTLHLLASAMLIDNVVRDREVDVFSQAVQAFNCLDQNDVPISAEAAKVWFREHHEDLHGLYGDTQNNIALTKLVIRLQDRSQADKTDHIEAIRAICHADSEYHVNERILISLIKAYWE